MQPGVDSVTFDFTIAAVTEGAPLPQKEDKDNTAASVEFTKTETKAIDFGAITFAKPGTYEYTLTEVLDDLDGGWVVTGSPAAVTIVVTDNKDGTMNAETSAVVIKNTFDTVKVEGEKKWNDEEYFDEDGEPIEGYERPDITVNLLADGQKIDSVVTTAADNWKFSFTDLPKYKDHGTEIVYTVTEDEVTAFEGEVDGYVIDNTPKRLDEDQLNPTELTIKKVDAETGNVIPTGATFVLKKGDTEIEYTTGEDGTVVIPFEQGGNEDGTYTLYEKKAPEGYTASDKTYTIVVDKEFDHVEIKENLWTWFYNLIFGDKTKAEFDEDTQTLTVENPPVKVKVEATKVWNDNNDKDKKRPDSITLTLTGTAGDKEVFTDTKTVTAKDSWKTAWTDLASYVDGEEVVFELTEAAIAGYTTDEIKVVKGEDGNYTVTVKNNHQSEPLKEIFSGSSTTNIDGQVVEPGQELTYKITYVNTTGATAETVTITDKIPEFTEFVSADNGGTEKDGTVTWTMSNVADEKEIVVQFVVKVKDDVNGQAVKNKAVVNDGTNDYETNEVVNRTPIKHDPPVKKIVKGEGADPNDEFKFSIEALYNTAGVSQMPMPNDASGKIAYTTAKAGETKEFGWITFTEPGTYVYEVKEVNNGLKNYKYDSTSYKLTYELASNDGDLKMTLTVTRNGAKYDHSAFEFENVYEPPVKTGDTTIIGEYVVIFFASIVLLLMILFRRRKAEEK